MTDSYTNNPFDQYPKTVVIGLGFPNDFESASAGDQNPTGWQGAPQLGVEHVSRETSDEVAARKAVL